MKPFTLFSASATLFALAPMARSIVFTINFETIPTLALQPSDFNTAGAIQTYTQPGDYSITGGVVLGNPSFLASFPANGSGPNLYGSTDIADPSLLNTITLTFPLLENVLSISGVLFNGQPIAESYQIDFLSGLANLNTINTPAVDDASLASSFSNFSFTAPSGSPITTVRVTTPNAALNGWDFFVDNVVVTAAPTGVPEAPAGWLIAAAMTLLTLETARRRRPSQQSKGSADGAA